MSLRALSIRIIVTGLTAVTASCAVFAQEAPFDDAKKVGAVRSSLITEASGMVGGRGCPGVLWIHNDSGDQPRVYGLSHDGDLLAIYTVTGAQARDWEDIAMGPGQDPNTDYLYIGDIGDNDGRYPWIAVYRVPEPEIDPRGRGVEAKTRPAEKMLFVYPDGPHDAETLLVDPLTRDIYVISKRDLFSRVYLAKAPQSTSQVNRLELVCLLPWGLATGGDVSPDGGRVVVRNMWTAGLWYRPPGQPLWKAFLGKTHALKLAREPQGEAICFDAQGSGYFTVSEGKQPPIYYFAAATGPAPKEPNNP